ncbi:MAG TPA: roadblock/LC7 domain-containing protein [Steroidobacteraceae bacterium]|nr:roadblock/LC7 domain-containing protein [Steroidobacteraceae bacterium]
MATSPRFAPQLRDTVLARLQVLVQENPGIKLAVVTSGDGFEIAAHPAGPVTQKIAAMSSSLQALSEAIAREAGLKDSRSLVVESENGTIVILGIAVVPRLSLAVVASGEEILGRLLWLARNCCTELERTLGS